MKYSFTFLVLLALNILSAQIILNHDPLGTILEGEAVALRVEIRSGFEKIDSAMLFFRQQGELYYDEMIWKKNTDNYIEFLIEDTSNYQNGLEYFFQIAEISGSMITLPSFSPQNSPYLITFQKKVIPVQDEFFILLSPDPDYTDFSQDFVIAVSFYAIEDDVDPESIQFWLNGKSVKAEIYSNMLIFKTKNLRKGQYNYQIKAKTRKGESIESQIWNMTLQKPNWQDTINLSGRAVLNTRLEDREYDDFSDNQKRANFLLNLSGKYQGFGYSSRIYLSSLETRWAQPVNRYSLSILTRFLDVTAGDLSPNYGTFVLSGKNVRGVHANLHFDTVRLKVSGGQSRRAVDGKEQYLAGTFATNTLSIRTEFGKRDGVLWGIAFTKNKDDVDSIIDDFVFNENDEFIAEPKDNIILGSDLSLALFRKRLLVGGEIALSYLNRNIYDGPMSIEEIEDILDIELDLPIDPASLEPILVINDKLEPFTPGWNNIAYKAFFRTYFKRNFLNLNYSVVGGSFNSISSNYLQTDTRIININDNINLLPNKLNLNASLNLISDNLNKEKTITSKTTNLLSSIMYRPTLPMLLQLSVSTTKISRSGDVDLGDLTSTMINISTSYNVDQIRYAPTTFGFSYMNYITENSDTTNYEYLKNNFVLSAKSNFAELPLEMFLSYTLSLEDRNMLQLDESFNYNSFYIKGMLDFLDSRLKPYADMQLNFFGGDSDKNSSLFNLGASYQIFSQTTLSTNVGAKFLTDNDVSQNDYSILDWRFRIVQRF
jgi:hypothetical protein